MIFAWILLMWIRCTNSCLVVICTCFFTASPLNSAAALPYELFLLDPKRAALLGLLWILLAKIKMLPPVLDIFLKKKKLCGIFLKYD